MFAAVSSSIPPAILLRCCAVIVINLSDTWLLLLECVVDAVRKWLIGYLRCSVCACGTCLQRCPAASRGMCCPFKISSLSYSANSKAA